MKSDLPYLAHIADSIAAIQTYVPGGLLVWDVIENELPPLKMEVALLIAELKDSTDQ